MSTDTTNNLIGAIAVIGLAGRFPQARDLETFWQNLMAKKEVVTFFTKQELLDAGVSPELIYNPNYVPAQAVLEDVEYFDASFFGYSPRDAQIIDPQQRLFLECAWQAMENAGYDVDRCPAAVGVFGGQSMNSYLLNNILANLDVVRTTGWYQIMVANDKDFLTTRTSYKLKLRGPSFNLQTACSTSLVAIHVACQSLLNYQCDMALAGGVSAGGERKAGYLYQPGLIMSPDGHCRAFDHKAHGIVSGEGVGIVVLKRLADALRDRDTIHAVIRGSAINNDGGLKVGYTAPSVDGQAEVILMAQAVGGTEPGSITCIEAHGTGTDLGDPIEISALTQAFRTGTQENGFCAISSVKTHMGHLDSAAGVAGFIKTVLALENKTLPPNLNFEKPNPKIDFEHSPFYVNADSKPWDTERLPRRAGVSSFGIGGTNAHVVLEEAPARAPESVTHPDQLLLLSARSESALEAAGLNLAAWLRKHPHAGLASTAYTLQVGRAEFKNRMALVCQTAEEAIAALEDPSKKQLSVAQQDAKETPVAFLFPGQGAQYVNMGRDLYESEPYFRQVVDQCADILRPHLGLDLREVLYPQPAGQAAAEELISQTWITQPALFTIEYATAKLWMRWGIQPKAMVGHSIGEYVAATLAGVFALEDGLVLVAERGKLMQSMPSGGMLSVPLSEEQLRPYLGQGLSLAVINAVDMSVAAGPLESIDRLQAELAARGITSRTLHTSHAFHSLMMDPILTTFTELVARVPRHAPQIPYLSNVTGTWVTAEQATDPAYWAGHIRSTVRFAQNVEALADAAGILLEVGPGKTLSGLAQRHPRKPAGQVIFSSLRHPLEQAADTTFITRTLGKLWLAGAGPDWQAYHQGETLYRVPLPTYPFERKRYWLDRTNQAFTDSRANSHKRKDISSWFYLPSWQRSAWPAQMDAQKAIWLLLCDELGVGEALARQLEAEGHIAIRVQPGAEFERTGERSVALDTSDKGQFAGLLKGLAMEGLFPNRIAHLQTLTRSSEPSLEALEETQEKGFFSLLALAQALGEQNNKNPLTLLVVSNGLHEVTGGEPVDPAKATILGPIKVIPKEYAWINCRSVDVVLPEESLEPGCELLRQIEAEASIHKAEPVVSHRGAHRWVQAYLPNSLPESRTPGLPLKPEGVYVITGGYGGIGLTLAQQLAKTPRARLALIGRSGVPERERWQEWLESHAEDDRSGQKIRAIQEMESLGAQVLLLKADTADYEQMKAALAQVRQQFGPINGVIHSAGAAGGGLMQTLKREQATQVFGPKVQGTWILARLLQGDPLDFFLLNSSISSVTGGFLQVEYSAANAFQDAFAARMSAPGRAPVFLAVNWAAWQQVGMAFDMEAPASMQAWKEENLRNGLTNQEGIEALVRILANPAPQTVVSPIDLNALLKFGPGKDAPSNGTAPDVHTGDGAERMSSLEAKDREKTPDDGQAPTTDIEAEMIEIWQDVIGCSPIGIHDNYFDLGGHSLMAVQILSRIRDLYHLELPLQIFFEISTIAELSKHIELVLWLEQNRETEAESPDDREEITL